MQIFIFPVHKKLAKNTYVKNENTYMRAKEKLPETLKNTKF